MARTTQSKILAISSNPETIMLLLIVGELWDPEVVLGPIHPQETGQNCPHYGIGHQNFPEFVRTWYLTSVQTKVVPIVYHT